MPKDRRKTNHKAFSLSRGQAKCYDSKPNIYNDKFSTWVRQLDLVSKVTLGYDYEFFLEDSQSLFSFGVPH
jgi:hypothetical protein